MIQAVRSKGVWRAILSLGPVVLGVVALLNLLDALYTAAQGAGDIWPLTFDGRSRFAGWSPDSRTVLVNRWGAVVGEGATRQMLSELWAIPLSGGEGHLAIKLSENAIQPSYTADGQRLAYLAFTGDGRWEAHVLDLASGREESWGVADWRMGLVWIGERLAFAREGRVWLSGEGMAVTAADLPALPAGARIRLSADGGGVAWSNGPSLWVVPHPGAEPRLLVSPHPRPLPQSNVRVLDFVWSPDGHRLAYIIADENPSPELWVTDVEGKEAPLLLVRGQAELFSAPSWSPDGRTLAFSRTPLGAETASASDIWLVDVDGGNLRPLLRNDLEESSPVWSPDGRYLAFNRAGDVWVLDVTHVALSLPTGGGKGSSEDFSNLAGPLSFGSARASIQLTPPITIRVIHCEENYYRWDVPVGQIDVITFENYVKRVIPVEVYTTWPTETLKAQAVAARSYAWYCIEHPSPNHPNWDVSDWADYQVMGREDQRHPRSDAAAEETQGQYIAYRGEVIKAFYCSEGGSPTRSMEGYEYIRAVDDPVSFGRERRGHGWGMSQWGAYRWAAWHGWGYQQILTHYYTGVTIELPSTGGPMPIGGVTFPWSDYFITSDRVHITANASDEEGAVSAVGFYIVTDTAALLVTDTVGDDGWSAVWDVAALSDTTSTGIILSVRISDTEGHVQSRAERAHIGLDRRPPGNITATINDAYTDTITITLSSLSAADPNPGSGVQMMAFSNEGWSWEGEDLYHQSGEVVTDTDALNGWAWRGLVGKHPAGAWYGPYTYELPPGHAYRAYFRLKTGNVITTAEVATLDVVDNLGERILGLRHLRGTDFRAANTYQEFAVDFNYTNVGTAGLEFRTAYRATADLYLDRVLIVGYPISIATNARWRLTPGEGLKVVTIKFIDGAGNVSADLTRTVTLLDTSPPTGWRDFAPEWWGGGKPPTCTVRVFDEISGLNVDSARYRFSRDGGLSWSGWITAMCTGISGTAEVETISAPAVDFGQPWNSANCIEFQIADMKGYTSSVSYIVRSRILYLPLILNTSIKGG